MPTNEQELLPRLLHRVRVKLSYPGQSISFQEREAILTRIDPVEEFAWFNIGVVELKVSWDMIDFLEGGIGETLDTLGSSGSGFGTDSQ